MLPNTISQEAESAITFIQETLTKASQTEQFYPASQVISSMATWFDLSNSIGINSAAQNTWKAANKHYPADFVNQTHQIEWGVMDYRNVTSGTEIEFAQVSREFIRLMQKQFGQKNRAEKDPLAYNNPWTRRPYDSCLELPTNKLLAAGGIQSIWIESSLPDTSNLTNQLANLNTCVVELKLRIAGPLLYALANTQKTSSYFNDMFERAQNTRTRIPNPQF